MISRDDLIMHNYLTVTGKMKMVEGIQEWTK